MDEVSTSALNYLLYEAVPLTRDVVKSLGHSEDVDSEVAYRTEKHGFQVGQELAPLVTQDKPFLNTHLDIMRFVCKELWMLLYGKNMDFLKTNHRDMYMLIDNAFVLCRNMSTTKGPRQTAELAQPYLWYPVGVIRGFLAGLGIKATVGFEIPQLPQVVLNVVIEDDAAAV